MTRKVRIIVALFVGTVVLYGISVFQAWKRGPLDDYVATIYVDSIHDLTNESWTTFETKGNISGLELTVSGSIRGMGTLAIAYNDTTIYKEYKLDSGIVAINHRSDWYTEKCLVIFTPIGPANGELNISCDFIGD